MPRQTVSNACYDGQHDDCGLYAPDGTACACACHDRRDASDEQVRQFFGRVQQWNQAVNKTYGLAQDEDQA